MLLEGQELGDKLIFPLWWYVLAEGFISFLFLIWIESKKKQMGIIDTSKFFLFVRDFQIKALNFFFLIAQ